MMEKYISAGETDIHGNICTSVKSIMRFDKSGWDIERKWSNGQIIHEFEPIIYTEPKQMNVASIVETWLTAHGYDGLSYEYDCTCLCTCLKDNLFDCSGPVDRCEPRVIK